MSFDPFNQQQPPPDPGITPTPGPGNPQPGGYPPPSTPPGQYYPPGTMPVAPPGNVRERIIFPAVLLLVSGILSLLFAGYFIVSGLVTASIPPDEYKARMMKNQAYAEMFENLEKEGYSFEQLMAMGKGVNIGLSVSNVLSCLLSIFGGIRLLQLRSYGLVMFSAILTAIPCLSGSGCCCIGEIAGLWTVVILLQADVYAAFR